jgi:hypothetical protein
MFAEKMSQNELEQKLLRHTQSHERNAYVNQNGLLHLWPTAMRKKQNNKYKMFPINRKDRYALHLLISRFQFALSNYRLVAHNGK